MTRGLLPIEVLCRYGPAGFRKLQRDDMGRWWPVLDGPKHRGDDLCKFDWGLK